MDFKSSESLDESHCPVTRKCQHAFLNIILSENFTLLCKLLVENFREMKADNLIGLSIMNARMKDGAYERSPSLFFTDIQLVICAIVLLYKLKLMVECIDMLYIVMLDV